VEQGTSVRYFDHLKATLSSVCGPVFTAHLGSASGRTQRFSKCGWCSISFSHVMWPAEVDFVVQAVLQIAAAGWKLLSEYNISCTHQGGAIIIGFVVKVHMSIIYIFQGGTFLVSLSDTGFHFPVVAMKSCHIRAPPLHCTLSRLLAASRNVGLL
jgi:hypothetical protein